MKLRSFIAISLLLVASSAAARAESKSGPSSIAFSLQLCEPVAQLQSCECPDPELVGRTLSNDIGTAALESVKPDFTTVSTSIERSSNGERGDPEASRHLSVDNSGALVNDGGSGGNTFTFSVTSPSYLQTARALSSQHFLSPYDPQHDFRASLETKK
ncbi:MAG TPA: hypothetical protein VIS48_06710 [Candidatus Kryptonia bacterium]